MKIFRDIEQGSLEWHKIRYGKVGGSTSKRLHTKGGDLLNELIGARLEPYDPTAESFKNEAMQRGNDLEPFGRKEMVEYLGIPAFTEVGWIQSSDCSLLGISPDGINLNGTLACEIKCPSVKKHVEYIRGNEIPLEYVHQCVHYFTVIDGLETLYFCSYRPESEKRLFIKTLSITDEVNIGTAARPKLATVESVCEMKLNAAIELQEQIELNVNQIKF